MFKDGFESSVSFLSNRDVIVKVDNVSEYGLTVNFSSAFKQNNLDVHLDHEDVTKMITVLQEAEKQILRNK